MSAIVSVGNAHQDFSRLLTAVGDIAGELPQPVVVQDARTPFESPACKCHAFLDMESFEGLVRQSDLLVMHAGAGSELNAIRVGQLPVAILRETRFGEHENGYQVEFAQALERLGKVVIVRSAGQLREAIAIALEPGRQHAVRTLPELLGTVEDLLLRCEEQQGRRGARPRWTRE